MYDDKIIKKIEEIYNSDKGKNFIIHLIRSFFPVYKASYLWERPKNKKKKLVCCITGQPLSSKEDILIMSQTEEFKEAFLDNMKIMFKNMDDDKPNESELMKNVRAKVNPLAITSEQSDKYLCQEAYDGLMAFYQNHILIGDKKITWVANNERAKEFVQQGIDEGIIETKKEEKAVHKVVENTKTTLGDLKALQDLKKKLDKQEKKEKE